MYILKGRSPTQEFLFVDRNRVFGALRVRFIVILQYHLDIYIYIIYEPYILMSYKLGKNIIYADNKNGQNNIILVISV